MRAVAAMLLFAAALPAQKPMTEAEIRASVETKEQERRRLWQAKDYRTAVSLLEAMVNDPAMRSQTDIHVNNVYNLACGYALLGQTAKAVARLRELLDLGYHNVPNIDRDTDFDGIRNDPDFRAAIAEMRSVPDFWDGPAWKTRYQPDLPEDDKIAGLSRFWAEAKYNFAWFEHLPRDFDWDALYLSYLPKVRATKSTAEYYRVLEEFCAKLKDSHTNIFTPGGLADELHAAPPVRTRYVEGRVLIAEVWDAALNPAGLLPGAEVVEVDGVSVKQFGMERVAPYVSASTTQDLEIRTFESDLLKGKAGSTVELTLRGPGGGTTRTILTRLRRKELASITPPAPAEFEYRMLPGNIAYVALNTFGNERALKEFERLFDEISGSAALIFDVRNNGGGNSGFGTQILSHFTAKPAPSEAWRSRDYVPAQRAWGQLPRWTGGTPETPASPDQQYHNPVVVLIGPRTFSAAEDFAVDFDIMGRGKLIGEPTGGSTGQPLSFTLPGGGGARVCTKQNFYPDGKQFVGVGIQPQILARPTVADFRAGRDTVLEKAVEYLRTAR
jgi:C-terminal processing protease CtpA/Prc